MIKLDCLSRWMHLKKGDILTLPGDAQRRIRLQVNSPKRSSLFIVNDDGELVFLAAPDGRDVVEFASGGDVRITTEESHVYVYTAENEPTFTIIPDAEIFTKIAERSARNPDLEHMMYLQQINMDRRFAQMQNDMQRQVNEAYEAGTRVANAELAGALAPKDDAGQSGQDGNGGAPAAGAGQAPSLESSDTGQNPPAGQPAPVGDPANQ